jgi:hypothetical protein
MCALPHFRQLLGVRCCRERSLFHLSIIQPGLLSGSRRNVK